MRVKQKQLLAGLVFVFSFMGIIVFGGGHVNAATITVGSGCTVNNAINSINAAANTGGCTGTGAYGTDDTITLPSGTTTLSADLPAIEESAKVIGAGKSSTNIDANGFGGFFGDGFNANDYTFQGFTITDANMGGVYAEGLTVSLTNVKVNNSISGVMLSGVTIAVSGCDITDNTNNGEMGDFIEGDFRGEFAGLALMSQTTSAGDIPTVNISDTVITGNKAQVAGLSAHLFSDTQTTDVDHLVFNIERTTVADNQAEKWGGIMIYEEGGTNSEVGVEFTADAVTVSGNSVEVVDANPVVNPLEAQPYISGMIFGGKLDNTQNLTNITAANNTIVNNVDDQLAVAGFIGSLSLDSANLTFTNATIVGNEVTQAQIAPFYQAFISLGGTNATFFVDKVDSSAPDIINGASAQNSLVAGNFRNGVNGSCVQGDKSAIGLSGTIDLTPVDLGNNISDDPACTGYTTVSSILATLGPLQNNGGPVETIALLDGSPAISSGGSVLGVTTDARGVARPGDCPSVGAFQFEGAVCGASTPSTSGSGNAGAPNTGANPVSLVGSLFASFAGLLTLGYVCTHKRA
jgi:hypothetical protein